MMILGFIGTTEIVIILIIALLVFGPQKLPEVGRQIGSLYQELNRMRGDVQRALDIDEYTRYDGRDNYSSYGSGYNYDTPTHDTDLHDGLTPQIEGGADAGQVDPPGPAGRVASSRPVTASAENFDVGTSDFTGGSSSDTTAQVYPQPQIEPGSSHAAPSKSDTAPDPLSESHKELN